MSSPDPFARHFGRPAAGSARAPGRVNLIGDHTDYCEGFALPVAVQWGTRVRVAPREDALIRVISEHILDPSVQPAAPAQPPAPNDLVPSPAPADLAHAAAARDADPGAEAYVRGVAELLARRGGYPPGWDVLIASDLPRAAGLSSSAALTVATALAICYAVGDALDRGECIELCREVEHSRAGVPCGVLDPAAALLATGGCAMLLDCRSVSTEQIPLALADCAILAVSAAPSRRLADSPYAQRRAECESALAHFRRLSPQVRALRDVTPQSARAQASQLDPLLASRAMHVVEENRRTLEAADALRRGDEVALGRLMNESHASLRDLFESSSPEVDRVVAALQSLPGVLGTRVTGAGFGGAVVALVRNSAVHAVEPIVRSIAAIANPAILCVVASAGARIDAD
ncbi:MAG: galactokinase [Planctomycetia bacterium]|nr:MAG: galactokinase [Planctomycetia bacterium]